MPHVLIAGRIHQAGLDLIAAAPGVTYDYVEDGDKAAYVPYLGAADGLVIRTQPLTAAMIAGAPRLRIVSRHGVGVDSVDVAALDARGIPLAIVGDVNSRSVAEHAMMLLLACAKSLTDADRAVRSGDWAWRNGYVGRELCGARLLVVGYGRTGRLLAGLAAGFGMTVAAFDPFADGTDGSAAMATDLGAALAEADFVSLHAAKGTRPALGAAEIARMKPGSVLVNTARGEVVDGAALLDALETGRIAAAGLDVFAVEPPDAKDALSRHPRVIATPHLAGLSTNAMERMAVVSVRNALDFFAGTLDPALVVNAGASTGRAAS